MLLINTYNSFAKYSAWELASLTHKEDPWRLTPNNQPIPLVLIKNYFTTHYLYINKQSFLSENIEQLWEIADLKEGWDGEEALPFSKKFIREVVDLVSTIQIQPDLGPTGRGSIQLEYGSRKEGQKYLGLEIFEQNRIVKVYVKDEIGNRQHDEIGMEDVNACIQQF